MLISVSGWSPRASSCSPPSPAPPASRPTESHVASSSIPRGDSAGERAEFKCGRIPSVQETFCRAGQRLSGTADQMIGRGRSTSFRACFAVRLSENHQQRNFCHRPLRLRPEKRSASNALHLPHRKRRVRTSLRSSPTWLNTPPSSILLSAVSFIAVRAALETGSLLASPNTPQAGST